MDDVDESIKNSSLHSDHDEDTLGEVSEILDENLKSNLIDSSHQNAEESHHNLSATTHVDEMEPMDNNSANSMSEIASVPQSVHSNLDHISDHEIHPSETGNLSQNSQINHQSGDSNHQDLISEHMDENQISNSEITEKHDDLLSHSLSMHSNQVLQSEHDSIPTTSHHESMDQINLSQASGSHQTIEAEVDDMNPLDHESMASHIQSEHHDEISHHSVSDDDVVADSIDTISEGQKDLKDELDKLEHMSEAGKIDDENPESQDHISSQNETVDEVHQILDSLSHNSEHKSHHEMETQTLNDSPDFDHNKSEDHSHHDLEAQTVDESHHSEIKFENPVHPLEEMEQQVSSTPDQNTETQFNPENQEENLFQSAQGSNSMENDLKTVITDDQNRPLTEGDKEEILDELEGKPISAEVHMNHKSIESLHHLNVYHYLPPKFISANAMPMMYPGMVPPQQQMTPGPIINIHNSTNSSGGNGLAPNGQMQNANAGPVVVANPATPTQNWGQVVYSNSHHALGNVSTQNVTQPLNNVAPQQNMVSDPNLMTQDHIEIDQNPELEDHSDGLTENLMAKQMTAESPEIINEQPIISNDQITVDPVVNTEVIDHSPINIETEDHSTLNHDQMSQMNEGDSEVHNLSENFSEHHPSVEITDSDLDNMPLTDEIKLEDPDVLDNVDEETVQVDPETINDENGQSVVLGEDKSEDQMSSKSMIII